MAGTGHQADATAHHDAVAPAQQGLRIRVDAMVEPVFLFEERRGMRIGLRRCAARCTVGHRIAMRMHALVQAMQIAASAERLSPPPRNTTHAICASSAQARNCASSSRVICNDRPLSVLGAFKVAIPMRCPSAQVRCSNSTGASPVALTCAISGYSTARASPEMRPRLRPDRRVRIDPQMLRARQSARLRACHGAWTAPAACTPTR